MLHARQKTNDRREDRFEREEKFAKPMETLPGKTLRDRALAARRKIKQATNSIAGNGNGVVSTVPAVRPSTPEPTRHIRASTEFTLHAPDAGSVQIAGSFNDWTPDATPLARRSDGIWQLEISLEPGTYEYRFIVDGVWLEDPSACNSVANPFGSRNSIRRIG